jgi:hypothetical protein
MRQRPTPSLIIDTAAIVLLGAAVILIRAMQWLYNRRLVREETTQWFLRVAKFLEKYADRLASIPTARR